MMAFLKKLFGGNRGKVAMDALPLDVIPTANIRAERNQLRMARLEDAIAAEISEKAKARLGQELARRKQFGR